MSRTESTLSFNRRDYGVAGKGDLQPFASLRVDLMLWAPGATTSFRSNSATKPIFAVFFTEELRVISKFT